MGQKNSKIIEYGNTVRKERDSEIVKWRKAMEERKKELGISAEKEERITKSYAHELVDMLNEGEATSREILTVLAHRCTVVGSELNLITEVDFEVADRMAQQYDDERRKSGKRNWTFRDEWNPEAHLPPLFGVPTSVKDMFDQKGKRSTLGVTARAHDIKEKDCGAVAALRQGGVIPFVRSNVSQTTLTY
jgi:Asp-tRNA(Asn)/Glu-tRNA(Gln) amidotransferase A subunit family amidase